MTAVLGEPLLFASNTPLSLSFLGVFLLDVIFFGPFSAGKCNLKAAVSQGCCPLVLLTILTRRGSRRLIVFVQMN